MKVEDKILLDISNKLDEIKDKSKKLSSSNSELKVIILSDINDELSDVLLNFNNDPLSNQFNDLSF